MSRRLRLVLALLISTFLAMLMGILSNVAANTLVANNPRIVWVALCATFIISLPITLYLFLNQLGGEESSEREPASRLPVKPYQRFFGRDQLLDEIMSVLREPGHKPIVGLDGMGGIGKTALAREVTERCLAEGLFDTIIWEPDSGETGLHSLQPLTWVSLMVLLGRQLGAPDIQTLPDAEKQVRLAALLQTQNVLIVLDNLETVVHDQDQLAEKLAPLLTLSKCLMTSRRRFRGDVYALHLEGLQPENGVQLLRHEASEKNIKRVAEANSQDLLEIAQSTGGSPLAMKLIAGQLQHLPLSIVLQNLQEVQVDASESDESDYIRFYKSIFWNSWQLLSETSQRLLVSMAVFAPGNGGTMGAIEQISGLAKSNLSDALEDLWRFSFLEIGEQSLRSTRYYLHPLTHYFVISDIVQPPSNTA